MQLSCCSRDLRPQLEAFCRRNNRQQQKKEDQLPGLRGPQSNSLPSDNSRNLTSQHHLRVHYKAALLALGADPWVVLTKTHGYHMQFSRSPPVRRAATVTTVKEPRHAEVLIAGSL